MVLETAVADEMYAEEREELKESSALIISAQED